MMRKTPASSMQKVYDECYLTCSTAIYFEGQNNEPEALRAWRNALDQIYYHNAYKLPSGYIPRSETEKALHDSLRAMELQCKERVDLLDALRKSREEAEEDAKGSGSDAASKSRESLASFSRPVASQQGATWLGGNTVPQASYDDIPRPQSTIETRPHAPKRPSYVKHSSYQKKNPSKDGRSQSQGVVPSQSLSPSPTPSKDVRGRTPSPEKKSGGLLKTLRSGPKEKTSSGGKLATSMRNRNPAAAKAATQVWSGPRPSSVAEVTASSSNTTSQANGLPPTTKTWDPYTRQIVTRPRESTTERRTSSNSVVRQPSPSEFLRPRASNSSLDEYGNSKSNPPPLSDHAKSNPPPPPPPHARETVPRAGFERPGSLTPTIVQLGPSSISYMKEYPNHPPNDPKKAPPVPIKSSRFTSRTADSNESPHSRVAPPRPGQYLPRKAVARAPGPDTAAVERSKLESSRVVLPSRAKPSAPLNRGGILDSSPEGLDTGSASRRTTQSRALTPSSEEESHDSDYPSTPTAEQEWDLRVKKLMKNLPKGVDEAAAKQIFNEIVIKGDEVHWDDVAGLDIAKSALKETVVYPFLRPDLFMGLREPARGMLLFGPPGTGKTMLARAVATESKSVFFAISASSLTSKYLGESEKLVRALFAIAKQLAPSIIFVDEIDSLLGARGGGSEHEATRRIKTEFLIQWSDLQKAAAGREDKDKDKGDATRVLVLAATNLPWAIDEAARRRFVRRQYIPLPEDWVREQQLRTLLSAQKHKIRDRDLTMLVHLTEGYSGSDITALAKDAAMGPLRSLGEQLLHMSPDEIRPIGMQDFEASLVNIRPSVSKDGLKEFEQWAKDFGERGG